MNQDRIWDYFQNEGLAEGGFSEARQRFVLRYLKPGQRVLNVGVGDGALERLALEGDIDVHALDPSARAVERLQATLNMGDRARCGYVEELPFEDAEFDVVVASEVFEHLDATTLDAAIHEIRRVLRPGGRVLVTTPHAELLQEHQAVCPGCGHRFHRWGHVQSFDAERLRHELSSRGFTVRKTFLTSFVDWRRKGVRPLLKSALRVWLARLGEPIADPHLVLVADRPADDG